MAQKDYVARQGKQDKKDDKKKDPKQLLNEGKKAVKQLDKRRKQEEKQKVRELAQRPIGRAGFALRINQHREGFISLPLLLQIFVFLVAFRWFRNAQEQAEAQHDLDDAVRFLRESRGFRP